MTTHEQTDDARGFSLLEMMTVITLVLVLANFSMPIYRSIFVHAREATLRDELFTLRSQIDRFTHDNERGPTSLEELVETGYMGAIPIDPITGSSETWEVESTPAPPNLGGELQVASLSVDGSAPLESRKCIAGRRMFRWRGRHTTVGRDGHGIRDTGLGVWD